MRPVFDPGERVVAPQPLSVGAVFVGVGLGLLPLFAFVAWTFGMSRGQVDRGHWVIPFVVCTLGGQWAGHRLARRWLGRTLILDWATRVATIAGRRARSFPFTDVTKVEIVAVQRAMPKTGSIAAVSLVVRTATEELVVRFRSGAPSERDRLVQELRPDAKKLARALGRALD